MRRAIFTSAQWIVVLTLLVLFSYWKIVFTKQFSILWQWEMVSQYYAWYTYAAAWIHKGIVPLWDPFRYGGNSFIGEMQNGLFTRSSWRSILLRSIKTACCPSVPSICSTFFLTGLRHYGCSF